MKFLRRLSLVEERDSVAFEIIASPAFGAVSIEFVRIDFSWCYPLVSLVTRVSFYAVVVIPYDCLRNI